MGFFRGMGRIIKPLVNVPKWMGAKQISSDASYITEIAKGVLTPQQAKRKEDFDTAVKRLNLTEKNIAERYKEFKRLSIIFAITFLVLFGYAIYLLLGVDPEISWRAIALSMVVSILALIQFLRFHYWMYQVKKRKLGCGFKEYFFNGLLGIRS